MNRPKRPVTALFVYGTLQDESLRARVLGRKVAGRRGRAPGFRRVFAPGRPWPVLTAGRPAEAVRGLVLTGLRPGEIRRLSAYEGPEYVLAPLALQVRGGGRRRVCAFLPAVPVPAGQGPWPLAGWRRRERRHALAAIGCWTIRDWR